MWVLGLGQSIQIRNSLYCLGIGYALAKGTKKKLGKGGLCLPLTWYVKDTRLLKMTHMCQRHTEFEMVHSYCKGDTIEDPLVVKVGSVE